MNVTAFAAKVPASFLPTLSLKYADKKVFQDEKVLNPEENISPQLLGTVVDALTKFHFYDHENPVKNPFRISLTGARLVKEIDLANELLAGITGFDDTSIINACKLTCYDTVVRAGRKAYKGSDHVNPDKETIENIRIMVERSITYLTEKTVLSYGDNFGLGYTDVITKGDCDFVCKNGIVDLKVYSRECGFKDLLQVIFYNYLMLQADFYRRRGEKKMGRWFKTAFIFNPRWNIAYEYSLKKMSEEDKEKLFNRAGFYI